MATQTKVTEKVPEPVSDPIGFDLVQRMAQAKGLVVGWYVPFGIVKYDLTIINTNAKVIMGLNTFGEVYAAIFGFAAGRDNLT